MWRGYWMWMEKPVDLVIVKYPHRWEIIPTLLIATLLLPAFLSEYQGYNTPEELGRALAKDMMAARRSCK